MSHNHAHSDTALPHLILSPTLNLKNNRGCISNLTSPFLLPIAAWLLSCLSSGYLVFWSAASVTLDWVVSSVVVPYFVPPSPPEICKRATWSPTTFFCGLLICFGFLFFNWGLGACDSGHDFRFILSFIFIVIVQIVWWEQPVSIFKNVT